MVGYCPPPNIYTNTHLFYTDLQIVVYRLFVHIFLDNWHLSQTGLLNSLLVVLK